MFRWYSAWSMLPHQPTSTATSCLPMLISHPAVGRRLSGPEWLVDGTPSNSHRSQYQLSQYQLASLCSNFVDAVITLLTITQHYVLWSEPRTIVTVRKERDSSRKTVWYYLPNAPICCCWKLLEESGKFVHFFVKWSPCRMSPPCCWSLVFRVVKCM